MLIMMVWSNAPIFLSSVSFKSTCDHAQKCILKCYEENETLGTVNSYNRLNISLFLNAL